MRSTIGTVVRVTTLLTLATSLAAQTAWTRVYPFVSPAAGQMASVAFDSVRGVTVLVGGSRLVQDSWQWNGTNWLPMPAGPAARDSAAMTFDAARGQIVLFGGRGNALNLLADTWTWDGSAWIQRNPAHAPSVREGAGCCFDPARNVVVLFGGDSLGSAVGDLWEWNGSDWQQRSFTGGPSPRTYASLAFDPNTGRSLLFGGQLANTTPLDETWSWNGSAWQRHLPPNTPYPRHHAAMVTDSARRRVVLLGSIFGNDAFAWEWDGATWTQQLTTSPAPRSAPAMAYDSLRHEVVLFGGFFVTNPGGYNLDDTCIWRTARPASFTAYGTGCGTPLPPVLAPQPYNLPWLGDACRTQVANLPQTAGGVFFLLGLASTPANDLSALGFPGCSTFVTLDESVFVPVTAGAAVRTLTVPNVAALAGLHVFEQAAVLDSASPNGLALSNAGELVLGIR